MRALIEYAWPGNVRELQHEVRRLVYLCPEGQAIDSTMVSLHIVAAAQEEGVEGVAERALDTLDLAKNVEPLERRLIGEALARAGGNRTKAAKLLGMSRNGLAIKMERLGISG